MKNLGEGKFLQLVEDGGWEFVRRRKATGVVVIAAVTEANELLIVEQFRKPIGQVVIELPAGLCGDENANEALEVAAVRELEEETGYTASGLRVLGTMPTSAGLTNEVATVFGVRGAKRVGKGGGVEGENITVHAVPVGEAVAWVEKRVAAGAFIDAKIYVGLHFACAPAK